jgi:hypothetical protein
LAPEGERGRLLLASSTAAALSDWVEENPAFERQTGLIGALGSTARELVPDLEPQWLEIYVDVALTGDPVCFEQGSIAMSHWFAVHALTVGDETRDTRVYNETRGKLRNTRAWEA